MSHLARRVLIVDDCRDYTDSLQMLLELNECEVRSAYDGPAALEIAEVFRPDVVLLDLCLPHMSGYEIASALRRLAERQEAMRIVAISGTIHPIDKPLIAPFSGMECVLCEYELGRAADTSKGQSSAGSDFAGDERNSAFFNHVFQSR